MMMHAMQPSPHQRNNNNSLHHEHQREQLGVPVDEPQYSVLFSLIQSYDWAGVLSRVASHPSEASLLVQDGRTPLHFACEHDAPAVVIQSLMKAFPEATTMTGTSNMTPLHITCSSQYASVHVIRVLLDLGLFRQLSMRDVDGDTALHAACRCGASMEVLEVLLKAHPAAVHERDYEGLTPLLRLWVRYFVILGDDVIDGVRGAADLTGELGQAWKKTELLLHYCYAAHHHHGSLLQNFNNSTTGSSSSSSSNEPNSNNAWVVHAASAVDCPRAVVKIASVVYPWQLDEKDECGRTPLMLAAQAPIFKVRDLSDDGYTLEDVIHGDSDEDGISNSSISSSSTDDAPNNEDTQENNNSSSPSVIEILMQANQENASSASCIPDNLGRLPLHMALVSGKRWNQGVKQLVEAYPEALHVPHNDDEGGSSSSSSSKLYPFMLAAAVGGDTTTDEKKEDVGAAAEADTATIYELLRHSPSLMNDLVAKRDEERKR